MYIPYQYQRKLLRLLRRFWFPIAAIICIGLVVWSSDAAEKWLLPSSQARITEVAEHVFSACQSARYRPTCYEEKIPTYMEKELSMEEAFEVARLLQRRDPQFVYCHVLGHKLAAVETAKDPAKWKDVAARSPVGLCSYGGIHGAFQERFRSEWLEPAQYGTFIDEVFDVCNPREGWNPTGVEQASCMHAMGHLTMFVSNGSVADALSLCADITGKARSPQHLPLCFDGVFMQVFQPLEPEDIALVESFRPKSEAEAKRFCSAYTGQQRSSCTSERWPYSSERIERDAHALAEYCAEAAGAGDENFCFVKMVNLMTARKQFSPENMTAYCAPLSGWRRESCVTNATSRMLENDLSRASDALSMCSTAQNQDVADACYEHLSRMIPYSIPNDTEQFRALCTSLPSPYDAQCLTGWYR